ncbi:MAG: hypothetical protein HC842_05910 [Cytophagales bacterium]|nr:hypothetical protein [Cytophagales bacterium]
MAFVEGTTEKVKASKPKDRTRQLTFTMKISIHEELKAFLEDNPAQGSFSAFITAAAYEKMKRLKKELDD